MRVLSHTLFALFAGAIFSLCIFVCFETIQLMGTHFVGFGVTDNLRVDMTSLNVWGAESAGFRPGDKIISVDGDRAYSIEFLHELAQSKEVGTVLTYQLEGARGDARFVSLLVHEFSSADVLKSHVVLAPVGLLFVLIAILFYFARPATLTAWSFFGLFASLGISLVSLVNDTLIWAFPRIYPLLGPFLPFLGFVLVGVIAGVYRPEKKGSALRRSVDVLLLLAFVLGAIISLGHAFTFDDIVNFQRFDTAMFVWHAIGVAMGMTLLVWAFRIEESSNRRARLRQIIWAWPIGMIVPTINILLGNLVQSHDFSPLWNVFLLLLPLSTADAVVRHDYLRLHHGARMVVANISVATIMGVALGVAMWASSRFLFVRDAASMIALAALLFALSTPINQQVQKAINKLLESAPYDPRRLLAEFTGKVSTTKQLSAVLAQLKSTLEKSVSPSSFALYQPEEDTKLWVSLTEEKSFEVEDETSLFESLARGEALAFDDEDFAPSLFGDAALAIPLLVASDVVGVLTLNKRGTRRAYEEGDIAFVSSLAGPLAASLINTRAYERIEAMNRQLEGRVEARTRELVDKNDELALLNKRKDELVATVSHDFRSPLAIIRQNVQTSLRDFHRMDEEDLRDFLEGIARQETRLSSMCENLLDLAKLKNTIGHRERVDLMRLCSGFVEGYKDHAATKGVVLSLETNLSTNASLWVLGDEARLAQVMQNLVDNAIKFTPAKGRVSLTLSRDDNYQRIEVSDTGLGIPADALPRLFEAFYQVPSNTYAGQGSGLGLAIVQEVVQNHHGSIEVESVVDEGTTFICRFPCAPEAKDHD